MRPAATASALPGVARSSPPLPAACPPCFKGAALSVAARRGTMEQRQLGKTGLEVSVLSFGCGAVGGLMTRGEPRDQERAVARALELGINYFDSAALYGNGTSETNLGRVLAKLKPSPSSSPPRCASPPRSAAASAQPSPARWRRASSASAATTSTSSTCHNTIAAGGGGDTITLDQLLNDALPAFERLRKEGKTRHIGITRTGRHAAAARGRRLRRLRRGADLLQRAQSDGRRDASRRLPGAGLPRA